MTPLRHLPLLHGLLCLPALAMAAPEFAPYAPRAAQTGSTLFRSVPAAESGLQHVPRVAGHPLSYLYHSGFVTGGLAIGDLDGDGHADLVFGGAAVRGHLYRGLGGMKFEDVTAKVTPGVAGGDPGTWTTGISLADVDADGDLDIHVCRYEAPNQLWLNQGGWKFTECAAAAGLAVTDASHSAYFFDCDGDRDLDVFLLTNKVEDPAGRPGDKELTFSDGGVIRIKPEYERYYEFFQFGDVKGAQEMGRPDLLFRNDGKSADGTPKFTDITAASGITGRGDGLSATIWDYNRDGRPDIYVGNDFLAPDKLWRNDGGGKFTNTLPDAAPHTCWFSMGADAGDLNNDLLPDFLIADMAATTHYKSKTTMGAMGGLNLQRAVAGNPPQYMRNTCLIGTGTGRFLEGAYLLGIASTDWTWSVKFADFDLDGWQDIYVTNGMVRAMNHSDRTVKESDMAGKHPWDFYKDREPRPEKHRAYKNEHHFHFADVSGDWGLGREAITYACATADLDRDGDLDLVEVNLDEPPCLYQNQATGNAVTFHPGTQATGTEIVLASKAGRQIRQLYPQSGYHSQNEAALHFGLGADTEAEAEITWPGGARTKHRVKPGIYTLQEPAAGQKAPPAAAKPALFAEAKNLPALRHQESPYDDYQHQILLPHALSRLGPALAWADVNGDGHDDLYLGGGADQAGELRLGDGKGGLRAQWVDVFQADKASEDMGAVFFDADGDGDADLFVASGSYQFERGDARLRDRLYLNDGKGAFTKAPDDAIPDVREASGPVCAADYDGDGDTDVFIGSRVLPRSYPDTPVSRLLQNDGKGRFTDATPDALKKPGMVSGAVWSDLNGDAWPDLLLAIEWGPVLLFLNDKGRLAERPAASDDLAKNTGWWLSVETADLDGDGDRDILAGNFGYNTKYKEATPKKPKLLYFADFDGTGTKNIVEVKREGDILFPERGRSCSSTAMPFLKKKFPTYETFAKATLSEVYGDKLDQADKYEANTLGTGIFWNDGPDGFRYTPLDRLAQVAPAFGLVCQDFDGDGLTDLFLAQNFHSAQIETGHYDGGLGQLLLNKGGGTFQPVSAGDSGIAIPGDAKAATVCELNGDGAPDLLVSISGGSHHAYLNNTVGKFLRVHLPAAKAPGALVTVTSGGKTHTAEYHAGGGYLSQSALILPAGTGGTVSVRWPGGKTEQKTFAGPGTVSFP